MQSKRSMIEHQESLALDKIHREIKGKLPEDVRALAKIVGKWIWIEFPPRANIKYKTLKLLKKLGFHYNSRRRVYQHPCGLESKRSIFDPRRKYVVRPLDIFAKGCNRKSYAEPEMTGATKDTPF